MCSPNDRGEPQPPATTSGRNRGPESSPVVLVPKPDGTYRFCNDFRKLNEVSVFDAYPMPRIDELIERLGPARFISTLDLTKGYWQVPLTKLSWEKTSTPIPVHRTPIRYAQVPSNLPEDDGPGPTSPQGLRRHLHRQHRHPQHHLDPTPTPPPSRPGGPANRRAYCQPQGVPPRSGRGLLPGLQGRE